VAPQAPDKASPEGIKRVKALLQVMDHWKTRVKVLDLQRDSDEYYVIQNEFWMGAMLMANAMGAPQSPIFVIFLMARRDILMLEEGLRERLAKAEAE
jgi:hypothetical protein